jgi:hypothetical protein
MMMAIKRRAEWMYNIDEMYCIVQGIGIPVYGNVMSQIC